MSGQVAGLRLKVHRWAPSPGPPMERASQRWPAYATAVLLCFTAVFISYLDRTNISVAAIAIRCASGQFGFERRDGAIGVVGRVEEMRGQANPVEPLGGNGLDHHLMALRQARQ